MLSAARKAAILLVCAHLLVNTLVQCRVPEPEAETEDTDHHEEDTTEDEFEAQDVENVTYKSFEDELNELSRPLIARYYPVFSAILADPKVSSECSGRLLTLMLGIRNNQVWAMRIALANRFISPNVFEGSLGALGGYRQCVNSRSLDGTLRGQYCTAYVLPSESYISKLESDFQEYGMMKGRRRLGALDRHPHWSYTGLRMGLCTLEGCSPDELTHVLKTLVRDYGENATVVDCETSDARPWLWRHTLVITLILVPLALVLIGTSFDAVSSPAGTSTVVANTKGKDNGPPGKVSEFLKCFSLVQNWRRFMDMRVRDKSLTFFFGLRVFLSLWVVNSHGYVLTKHDTVDPGYAIFDLHSELQHNVAMGAAYLVASGFFFITGFLIGFTFMHKKVKILKKNLLAFCARQIGRRYLRLTVPLLVVLLYFLMSDLFTYGATDGKADYYRKEFDACVNYWPSVLLHYSNFLPWKDHCLDETWYVACEMQIYLVVLPLTLLLLKSPRAFIAASGIITVVTVGYAYFLTATKDLYPIVSHAFPRLDKLVESTELVYHKPWSHISTYLLGVLCGYCVVVHGKRQFSANTQRALWLFSGLLTVWMMTVNTLWNSAEELDDIPHRRLVFALYGALHRTLWGVAMFWMVYAMATGRGGFLYTLYSWPGFHVLSKLSYGIFLTHYPILLIRLGRLNTLYQIDRFIMSRDALGRWMLAIIAATLMNLFYEQPAVNLERLIGKWRRTAAAKSPKSMKDEYNLKPTDDHSNMPSPIQVITVPCNDKEKSKL